MVIFSKISNLFDYPGPDYNQSLVNVEEVVLDSYPKHYLSWRDFSDVIHLFSNSELQELFIASFDIKSKSTLDIGHVLFGEDKSRNKLLIHLKEEYTKRNLDIGVEMPDYLPNLLSLISQDSNSEFPEELCICLILPALRLMRSQLGGEANPYIPLFSFLIGIIQAHFPESKYQEYVPVAKTKCNFSKSQCNHG